MGDQWVGSREEVETKSEEQGRGRKTPAYVRGRTWRGRQGMGWGRVISAKLRKKGDSFCSASHQVSRVGVEERVERAVCKSEGIQESRFSHSAHPARGCRGEKRKEGGSRGRSKSFTGNAIWQEVIPRIPPQ